MIVFNASVVVEILIGGVRAGSLVVYLAESGDSFAAPHLFDAEVMNALRNLAAGQRLDPHRVEEFLANLAELPLERFAILPLTHRIRELRHNFTACETDFIALAEETNSGRAKVVVVPVKS